MIFTDRSKALLLLWIYASCLYLLCCLACFLQPCDHLLGNCCSLGSLVCWVFLCFVTFPHGVSGQVWYSIISISDLCLPRCFHFIFHVREYTCFLQFLGGTLHSQISVYEQKLPQSNKFSLLMYCPASQE